MLTTELRTSRRIRNWTAVSGYLDRGDFDARYTDGDHIDCILENGSVQKVPKDDSRIAYENREGYIKGTIRRHQLRDQSRFTKYTISITHKILMKVEYNPNSRAG